MMGEELSEAEVTKLQLFALSSRCVQLEAENTRLREDIRFLEAIAANGRFGGDFRRWLYWVGGEDGYLAERSPDEGPIPQTGAQHDE